MFSGEGGTDGKDLSVCACVCSSAHDCGCVHCKNWGYFKLFMVILVASIIVKRAVYLSW